MPFRSILFGLILIVFQITPPIARAQDSATNFGLPDDIAFAAELWQALRDVATTLHSLPSFGRH